MDVPALRPGGCLAGGGGLLTCWEDGGKKVSYWNATRKQMSADSVQSPWHICGKKTKKQKKQLYDQIKLTEWGLGSHANQLCNSFT